MERAGIDGQVSIIVNGYWRAWQKLRQLARARKSSLNSFAAVSDMVSFRMVVRENDEMQCYRCWPKSTAFWQLYRPDPVQRLHRLPAKPLPRLHTAAWMQG
jgi:hypothetical protein